MSYVSSVNNLLLIVEPIVGEFAGPLYQQPSLMAVDEQVGMFYKIFKADKNPILQQFRTTKLLNSFLNFLKVLTSDLMVFSFYYFNLTDDKEPA